MSITPEQMQEAARWAAALYEERTILVAQERSSVLESHPAYRVSWHEVVHNFPAISSPESRVAYQPIFESEIRKRWLIRVLRGQETALDWYIRKTTIKPKRPARIKGRKNHGESRDLDGL